MGVFGNDKIKIVKIMRACESFLLQTVENVVSIISVDPDQFLTVCGQRPLTTVSLILYGVVAVI